MRINIKNYTTTLILLLANLFSAPDNRNESVLIFQINNSIAPLEILNDKKNLVDYEPLDNFLINNNAIKIKKWSKFATSDDVHNDVQFSMIYTVFFSEGTIISNIKNQLEQAALNCPVAKSLASSLKQNIFFHYSSD